jgi:hypothetical protein
MSVRLLARLKNEYAGIAQLARASPCQGEGRGFESLFPLSFLFTLHYLYGRITKTHIISILMGDISSTINSLINRFDISFSAIHGTSFSFIEKLSVHGQITGGGNFGDHFYVLTHTNNPYVDIVESAEFYSDMNAIKDLISSLHPQLNSKIIKNIDPYLFIVGLNDLSSPLSKTTPYGFDSLSADDIKAIRETISIAKKQDRRGVIIYFSSQFLTDFPPTDITDTGQAKILLDRPISLKYISSVRLRGQFEIKSMQSLLQT